MIGFIIKRILSSILVLIIVSILAFFIMALIPGDPAAVMAGIGASGDEIAAIREQLGLNQPLPVRLVTWLGGVVQGDLGQSMTLGRPVLQAIGERLPATLSLAGIAFLWTLVLGIGSGIVAAFKHNTWIDRTIMTFTVLGVSLPSFWLGLMLIVVFGVNLNWLPTGGYVPISEDPWGWIRSLVLPSFALSLLQIGLLGRITRGALLEVLRQDYIRTAKAKGLSPARIYIKHAFLNATIPIATVLGIILSLMLSGAVIIETVFSIPGIGRLMATTITSRDYPVIQGTLIVTAAIFVTINLLIDLLYVWLDPRIRYS